MSFSTEPAASRLHLRTPTRWVLVACGAVFALVGVASVSTDPGSMIFGSLVFLAGTWATWTAVRAGVSVADGVVERRGYSSLPKRVAAADVVGVRVVAGESGSDALMGTCQPELILANGGRLSLTPLARYALMHGEAAVRGDVARLAEALGVEDHG